MNAAGVPNVRFVQGGVRESRGDYDVVHATAGDLSTISVGRRDRAAHPERGLPILRGEILCHR